MVASGIENQQAYGVSGIMAGGSKRSENSISIMARKTALLAAARKQHGVNA